MGARPSKPMGTWDRATDERAKTAHDLVAKILAMKIIGTNGVEWTDAEKKAVLGIFDLMAYDEKLREFRRGADHGYQRG